MIWSSLVNFAIATLSIVPFFGPPLVPTMKINADFEARLCESPTGRREWRTLSRADKAEWVRAVKVGHSSHTIRRAKTDHVPKKCVADMPHNSSIIATGHSSEIPTITADTRYYDGNARNRSSPLVYIHPHSRYRPRAQGSGGDCEHCPQNSR